MIHIALYQVDAFTDRAFSGNPAAVCLMDHFPQDHVMQFVAAENNLAETAFLVPNISADSDYILRWFTPTTEVDLCGHATLASAFVLFTHECPEARCVRFKTNSGILAVERQDDAMLSMDFPALKPNDIEEPEGLAQAMGIAPISILHKDRDFLLVYENETQIRALEPDFLALKDYAPYGFVATAPMDANELGIDFVSRCFFPNHGIDEDPVTGSAHCLMAPYWANRLGKNTLRARQLSKRQGDVWIEVKDDRVILAGRAIQVIQGELLLPE